MRFFRWLFGDPLREVVQVQNRQLDEYRETIRYMRDRERELRKQLLELARPGVTGRIARDDRAERRERPGDTDEPKPREPIAKMMT